MRSQNYTVENIENKCIAVIGGGNSTEREVSLRSSQNVYNALKEMELNVIQLDPAERSFFSSPFDIAFNCLHGAWGEDGGLQGYCELKKIPYTGPGVLATTVGFNKPVFKSIIQTLGVPVPNIIKQKNPSSFPFIVKPVADGSSIGISIVKSEEDWQKLIIKSPEVEGAKYFKEEYLEGKEITSGVLTINGELTVLPILEINTKNEFYDYDGKYTKGKTELIVPAVIPSDVAKTVREISKKIYIHFNCKGCIRIDMIIHNGLPKVLEMNTNPGLTTLSDIPAQAKAMGIPFNELVLIYLQSAKT
jgi:D-alanine-D-alanine ligase